jgi:hypothetical protein
MAFFEGKRPFFMRLDNQTSWYFTSLYHSLKDLFRQQDPDRPESIGPNGEDWFIPCAGRITFEAEGQEGGKYHSRKFHYPGGASGVTIGRGLDLGKRTKPQITTMLTKAWSPHADCYDAQAICRIQEGSWITGSQAEVFCKKNREFEITPKQQYYLFEACWMEAYNDVMRITNDPDVITEYGKLRYPVNPLCLDIVVDLRYRGDYTPRSRRLIQRFFVDGDAQEMLHVLENRTDWLSVPTDRFNRRVALLKTG